MFEILKIDKETVKVCKKVEQDCWINIIEPTDEDIKKLKSHIEVTDEIINSLKDGDEIPTTEEHATFSFIIIRTPYNHPKSEPSYTTQPLGIILNDKFVVTICFEKNDAVEKLKTLPFDFKKSQFVLRLLLKSSRLYLVYLKDIHKKMIILQEEIEVSQKNKVIMNFLELETSLVYFDTSLKSNYILLENIKKNMKVMKYKENFQILDQIEEETKQGIQMTEVYSNILSNTLDAFASIISNNLNIVMKTLTSLTLIFSIPMLIASIYGMNVDLPYGHARFAFIFVMLMSLILSVIAAYVFAKKKFFG
ncbi:MAG: magnesium transporter CorA family protein [archaeon]